jgi:hypothetical protein
MELVGRSDGKENLLITDMEREGAGSGFEMECDTCGETEFFDRTYFRDFIADAKASGWKITKDDEGNWIHTCPTCAANPETGDHP